MRAERLLREASEMQRLLGAVIAQSRKVTAGERHIKDTYVDGKAGSPPSLLLPQWLLVPFAIIDSCVIS